MKPGFLIDRYLLAAIERQSMIDFDIEWKAMTGIDWQRLNKNENNLLLLTLFDSDLQPLTNTDNYLLTLTILDNHID